MLEKTKSRHKKAHLLTAILLLGTIAIAQESGNISPGRQPHPPTTRPPEISARMKAGMSPLPYIPNQAIQQPVEEIQSVNQTRQMPPIQNIAQQRRTAPVIRPPQKAPPAQPMMKPQPAPPVMAEVQKAPESLPEKAAPTDFSGYIVFVAGALLLCRKADD